MEVVFYNGLVGDVQPISRTLIVEDTVKYSKEYFVLGYKMDWYNAHGGVTAVDKEIPSAELAEINRNISELTSDQTIQKQILQEQFDTEIKHVDKKFKRPKQKVELYGRGVIVEPPKPCECYYGNACVRGQRPR
jgi:hypothetical protein